MKKQLTDFMFRGLLGTHSVRDMEAVGLLRPKVVNSAQQDDVDLFASVPESVRAGSIYMQRCYRMLFILENMVRTLVADVLQERDGPEWFDKRASQPMKKKVAERREKESRNNWHAGRNTTDVSYLDFGDLAMLIQTHWADFKDLLPPRQEWVMSRLSDAERTRNVIAHTNVLADEEVSRLEMIVTDWIKQVG